MKSGERVAEYMDLFASFAACVAFALTFIAPLPYFSSMAFIGSNSLLRNVFVYGVPLLAVVLLVAAVVFALPPAKKKPKAN